MAGQATHGPEPTLDLVLAQVQATKAAAAAQIAALDTKAGLVLGSASFLAAAVAGLQSLIAGKPGLHHALTVLPAGVAGQQHPLVVSAGACVTALTIVALCVYLFTVYAAWQAYRATTTYVVPAPPRLEAYLTQPADVVKRVVIRALTETYTTLDAPMLAHKFVWTRRALGALLTEAVISAIIIGISGVLVIGP